MEQGGEGQRGCHVIVEDVGVLKKRHGDWMNYYSEGERVGFASLLYPHLSE